MFLSPAKPQTPSPPSCHRSDGGELGDGLSQDKILVLSPKPHDPVTAWRIMRSVNDFQIEIYVKMTLIYSTRVDLFMLIKVMCNAYRYKDQRNDSCY